MDVLFASSSQSKIAWYENLLLSTSTNELFQENTVNISPNPFHDFISIEKTNQSIDEHTLNLFNAMGEQVQSVILKSTISQLPTIALGNGLYFYSVVNDAGLLVSYGKLIKH